MELSGIKIGVGMTGSFCTFEKSFHELERLKNEGAELFPIFSWMTQGVDCRFGDTERFQKRITEITGHEPMKRVEEAETIGPHKPYDLFLILPCTGNTMAKLANGITDSPVLMGAKAHLRNNLPLVISLATNDGLGMNLKNVGYLLPTKHIFFVPFGQDDPVKKPNSIVAHTNLVLDTVLAALKGKQLQPVLQSY